MTQEFLKKVYEVSGDDALRDLYDEWADSYDAETGAHGYATPARCAEALRRCGLATDAEILDMGCGTGLSGAAFAEAGFTTVDGSDLSPGMLDKARALGVYRDLWLPDNLPDRRYDAVAAVGVIGPGAAPLDLFDSCLEHLAPGGLFVLSFNDHALNLPEFPARIARAVEAGVVLPRFEEHGPHLPGLDMKSTVYVLEHT
ncbi:MAG: methyltransferase domain-containing protein [Nioella sp.]